MKVTASYSGSSRWTASIAWGSRIGLPADGASDAVGARARRGNGVEAAGVPRVAAAAAGARPASCRAAPWLLQRLDGVGRAGRVEPAARPEQRATPAAGRRRIGSTSSRAITAGHALTDGEPTRSQRPGPARGRAAAEVARRGGRAAPGPRAGCPAGSRSSRAAHQVPQPAPDPVAGHGRPDARETTKPTRAPGPALVVGSPGGRVQARPAVAAAPRGRAAGSR